MSSEVVLGMLMKLERELLPHNMSRRWRRISRGYWIAFGRMVETILGEKEAAERIRKARGGRPDG